VCGLLLLMLGNHVSQQLLHHHSWCHLSLSHLFKWPDPLCAVGQLRVPLLKQTHTLCHQQSRFPAVNIQVVGNQCCCHCSSLSLIDFPLRNFLSPEFGAKFPYFLRCPNFLIRWVMIGGRKHQCQKSPRFRQLFWWNSWLMTDMDMAIASTALV